MHIAAHFPIAWYRHFNEKWWGEEEIHTTAHFPDLQYSYRLFNNKWWVYFIFLFYFFFFASPGNLQNVYFMSYQSSRNWQIRKSWKTNNIITDRVNTNCIYSSVQYLLKKIKCPWKYQKFTGSVVFSAVLHVLLYVVTKDHIQILPCYHTL